MVPQDTLGLDSLAERWRRAPVERRSGRVVSVHGTLVTADVPGARLGEVVQIAGAGAAETVGFRERHALLMPFGALEGVHHGARVDCTGAMPVAWVGNLLKGRVIDGFGEPLDGKGPVSGLVSRPLHAAAPDALARALVREPLPTGVRVIDGLLTFGRGQRVGLMAGSGVGKSTLMGMIARRSAAAVNVIALIGERGREVREFLEDVLGPDGLRRSVVVVVTSDKAPVLQLRGAFLAMTIAEHFRDQGADVMMMVDSVTRLAMAQRQIGLAVGEPPTTRGYTPSCFALLPRLLERAGPADRGSITALYTVLVDGDDVEADPVGDAVRGVVDGHVVLSRRIAAEGRFPAVNVLQSISRVQQVVVTPRHYELSRKVRAVLAAWNQNEELVRLGAYKAGSSPVVDDAIARIPRIHAWLTQPVEEATGYEAVLQGMDGVVK
ncbi:MAG: FliI/YscN family ATPase [Deltaproteobacteria bacterium]|nr:FliI/YscN family ATPase [Deltaproteobacteria bacterium]